MGRRWDKQLVDGHVAGLVGRNASARILGAHSGQLDECRCFCQMAGC